jgi:hypothetical protein
MNTEEMAYRLCVGKWCFLCDLPCDRLSEVDNTPVYLCEDCEEHWNGSESAKLNDVKRLWLETEATALLTV